MKQPIANPIAPARNVVTFGRARFTLLTARMVRLEFAADGQFEDRPTLTIVNRQMPAVSSRRRARGKQLRLETDGLILRYTDDGQPFSRRNLSVEFRLNGRRVVWHPGQRDPLNLKGAKRTLDSHHGHLLWNKDRQRMEPAPEVDGLLSRSGWAVVDDSAQPVLARQADGRRWPMARPLGTRRDLYLLAYGHDYRQALADAARVFGGQPLPPRFTLGYWWSRWWAYTDKELERIVEQFQVMGVPLDVLVLDMDWHREGWAGYTFERSFFPDPAGFLRWCRRRGLKVTMNLHPAGGVTRLDEPFEAMARALGQDPRRTEVVPFDCADRRFMDAYFKLLHHPHEDAGVAFWWMDWQQGTNSSLPGLDPLPWLNHLHWEDMARRWTDRRPLIFSRFGGIGAGRYPIGFSGDTEQSWRTLRHLVWFTAASANSLFGYWSHDTGGFFASPFGGKLTPELYVRWMQYTVHSPILRTHAGKAPDNDRRFWVYGEPYNEQMIHAVRQRYELIPYLYTENRKCCDHALSLCRPMYYEYPEEPAAYAARHQYKFGEQMLVAPVLQPAADRDGLAATTVWLPAGRWIDTATGDHLTGGKTHRRRYALDEIPVFVRPGAIIPGRPGVSSIQPGSDRALSLTVYPGADGAYELYEDDGETTEYQQGRCGWMKIRARQQRHRLNLIVEPMRGDYRGLIERRSLTVRLPLSAPPRAVCIGRRRLRWHEQPVANGWSYDGETATTTIHLSEFSVRRGLRLTIECAAGDHTSLANGLKGRLRRCWLAFDQLRQSRSPLKRSAAALAQTGHRIRRQPATFATEYAALQRDLTGLLKQCAAAQRATPKDKPEQRRALQRAQKLLRSAAAGQFSGD